MTKPDFAAIRDLHAKTNQGAWISGDNQLCVVCEECNAEGCIECHMRGMHDLLRPNKGEFLSCHDAEFCAQAHQDIPALIAEVERLRKIEDAAHAWSKSPERDMVSEDSLLEVLANNPRPSE